MPDQPDDAAHSDEHRPATEPASAAGDRGESNPSDAVQLLKQILGRLQRMEGGLSQHEEWLRRIEQEHRQAAGSAAVGEAESAGPRADEGELKRLIGALTLERDRAAKALAEAQRQLGQYQQELTALRRQSADAHSRLAERDKQLAALKEAADGDRQQTASLQSDLSRQLQQRHEQLHAAQQRLAGLEQQAAAREKQVVDLQAALDQAATKFEALSAELTVRAAEGMRDAAQAGQVWPRFARYAVAAALVAAFASAGLTAWLYHRSAAGAVQRISAIVTAPGIAPEVLNQCATAAIQNRNDLQATVDPRAGTLELRLDTPQVSPGVAAVDAAARAIVARLAGAASVAASQPAGQPEVRSLAARIAETDKQISAATRPVPGAVAGEDAARLPERWQALHEERGKAIAALAEIQARTEPKPVSADAANVTAELIAKAEAADAQFQTEIGALKQREDQVAGRLRVSIDAAAVQFQALRETLTTADGYLQKLLQEDHPEDVAGQLKTVRESLKTWDHAVGDLDSQWRSQRKSLDSPGSTDVLALQGVLEKAARAFIKDVTAASSSFNGALAAIGQGQDQTTKRLVLHNTLVKELSPVTTAEEAVLNAARSAILAENVELTAIAQRLDALRQQVQQRRAQLVAGLRQDRANRLQQEAAALAAQARQEQARLTQRVAEIDAAMLKLGEQAAGAAAAMAEQSRLLADEVALHERQARDLAQLVRTHERFAQQVASLPPPPAPGYLPARVLVGENAGLSMGTTLLLGMLPATVCTLAILIAWLVVSSRQSRETIEEYARSLKDMARATGPTSQ